MEWNCCEKIRSFLMKPTICPLQPLWIYGSGMSWQPWSGFANLVQIGKICIVVPVHGGLEDWDFEAF